ncbi:MAG: tetratricopeptide repeat protein [Chloroflexi bacterium]|nr:tetratricopeptide repeat protein [Chloroflexota bacterium]
MTPRVSDTKIMMMNHKLILALSCVDNRYHLQARSRLGEAEADLALPFSEVEERALLRALEPREYQEERFPPEECQALRDLGVLKGDRLVNLLRTVGEALYGALTADDGVRQRVVSTLDAARLARQPLQVEMRFGAGTDRLARLPWELVCDRGHFLVQDTTIALSRYPEAAVPVSESLGDLPLRVLLVISRPAGVAPLDPEKERRALLHGLRTLIEEEDVVVNVLRPPTSEMLAEAVTTGGYHVVHFDGHGVFALQCPECEAMNAPERATCGACGAALHEVEAQGYLTFEDNYGAEQDVSADQLAATLHNTDVRLVVLSACQTAVTAAEGMWTGVAPALLRAGVPLVVAMQCSVPTNTAAAFARQFYASLAHGKPLNEAVADGCRPLVGRPYHNTWFIPVLYARTAAPPLSPPTFGGEFRLFRPRPPEAEVAPERDALRQELRQRRAELDHLEEAAARQGTVLDPAQMAALRDLRSEVAGLRSTLAGAEARGVARSTSVLYGVPSNPYFVGRADEIRSTVQALEERQVVVVWGAPGIGKSYLATEIAHRHSWRWPGGVLWLSCRNKPAFETLLNQMGAFCGQDVSQADPARKPELVRGLLAGLEDCLLIWDNYEDVEGDEDVRRFLERLPASCHALLTSRVDPDVRGWRTVPLGGLADEAMRELFAAMAVDENVQIATVEDLRAIPAVIQFLEGHPLALSLFVPLVTRRRVSKVWAELRASPLKGVEASLALSYDALGENSPLQKLFTRLSVFNIPVEEEAAASVGQVDEAIKGLEELVRRSLLRYDGVRYGYHALVRQYAYARLGDREDPRAVHRLAAQYLNTKLKETGGTPQEALEECDQWEKAEAWEEFAESSSDLVGSLDRMGYWPEIMERLERARAAVREHLDDARLEATLLNGTGAIAHKRANWDQAIQLWEEASEVLTRVGEWDAIGALYNNIGESFRMKGEWDRAIEFYEKSLETKERVGDIHGMAQTYNNLGLVYADKGEWDRAIEFYEKDLEISERVGDIHGMAQTYNNLGLVYADKGEWERAIEFYEKSLETKERVGDIHGMAVTYMNIGNVYYQQGKWDEAIEQHQKSLEIREKVGDIHGMAQTYNNLGLVYADKGEWDRAIEFYENALQTMERVGDIHGMASTYGNLGNFYAAQGDTDQAAQYYTQAFLIFSQLGAAPQAQQVGGLLVRLLGSAEKAQEYVEAFVRQQGE